LGNSSTNGRIFNVKTQAITKHLSNIYKEEELIKKSTCSKMEQVQTDEVLEIIKAFAPTWFSLDAYDRDAFPKKGYKYIFNH